MELVVPEETICRVEHVLHVDRVIPLGSEMDDDDLVAWHKKAVVGGDWVRRVKDTVSGHRSVDAVRAEKPVQLPFRVVGGIAV